MSRPKGARSIKPERVAAVIRDRARRYTYDQIAARNYISTSSVWSILREHAAIPPRRKHEEMARLYKAVAADYVRGVPRKEICETHRISMPTIYTALTWCERQIGRPIPRRRYREERV